MGGNATQGSPGTGVAMNSMVGRALAPVLIAVSTTLFAPFTGQAQQNPQPNLLQREPQSPAQSSQQNPVCVRLELQLAAFDRGGADPVRAEQIQRFEEAASKQQAELNRQTENARRLRCEGNSFFVLFSNQAPQCGPINAQIQQMRGNLERIQSDLDRLKSANSGPEREGQRRAILVALSQANCGAQYSAQVTAATQPRSGGLFETLFGAGSIFAPGDAQSGGAYRTVCVRTCDGYYYPISYSTGSTNFANDERTCQRSCPAAEVMLFSHRNPGEDMNQAVSISGQLYTSLPNAFLYRQAFDASCSCRRPGETWAQALKHLEDTTVEQGDIVVSEERARQMSQPRVDAQGRPIRPDARPASQAAPTQARAAGPAATPAAAPAAVSPGAAAAATAASVAAQTKASEPAVKPDPNRQVRSVGPTFLPAR